MKIVIKIDEELYNRISEPTYDEDLLRYIIANGTPLPKGHGRLIDADALIKKKSSCTAICLRDKCDNCVYKCVSKFEITNADTIIEADKA